MKNTLLFPLKNLFLSTILCFFITCKKKSNSYNLDISIKNNGTVNYESGKYPSGETIILEAKPESGFRFIGWEGKGLENPTDENPITVFMDSNKSIIANFVNINNPDYSDMGFWADEIYSSIDWDLENNFSSIVEAFVKDGERHGVDLSHVLENELKFTLKEDLPGGKKAYGAGMCWKHRVNILYKSSNYFAEIENLKKGTYGYSNGIRYDGDVPTIFKTMWHEFGHDILNLKHNCGDGFIMNGSGGCKAGIVKSRGSLSWFSNDNKRSIRYQVKILFEGVNQRCMGCENYDPDYVDNYCNGQIE